MDILAYILAKKYTDKIAETFAGGLKYQGSVADASKLPAASSSNKGHMYTTLNDGHEHVSDGKQWVDLGADLNNKADKTELTAETNDRISADDILVTNLNQEINARTTADATLQTNIDAKQAKLTAGANITIDANNVISASTAQAPEYIELSFYDDLDTGTLTDAQAATLAASELNYIWLNGMHRLDFRYEDKNNNKATYSAVDTSSDGNKTHSVEINLTTKVFIVYHRTLQEYISDLATIRSGAALGATAIQQHQDISGKQDKLTAGTDIAINDNTISVSVQSVDLTGESGTLTEAQVSLLANSTLAFITLGGKKYNFSSAVAGRSGIVLIYSCSVDGIDDSVEITGTGWVHRKTELQPKLTAGTNVAIENNVISATDTVYDDTAVKADIAANTTALGGLKLVALTQTEYDNLPVKDASTFYIIKNA